MEFQLVAVLETAGLPEERAFNTNTHTTFRNTWSFHIGGTVGQLGTTYCYSCARGGPAVRQDSYLAPWAVWPATTVRRSCRTLGQLLAGGRRAVA